MTCSKRLFPGSVYEWTMGDMELSVEFNRQSRSLSLPEGSTVQGLLDSMGLYPDAHIVVRGRTPIPLDQPLSPGDSLRIIRVASGG
ncbi:MAG: hypothetical protein A4E29_00257 [Methanomassiliicoccales archaeon PtaB.Bin134]|nr:MAG: hypothetical protein A4E29_00257 [Methanomassiliicoccales archaeon PtaB.Bin134]